MTKQLLTIFLSLCIGMSSAVAVAQGTPNFASKSSEVEMPAVQEPKKDQAETGLLSGEKAFALMVDQNDNGEIIYQFDDQQNLETIQAKRGVVFASDDMTLNSDDFEYQTLNSLLVATGKKVVVRLGEIVVTCQNFKYNPDTQEGEFTGQPALYQRRDGKVTMSSGSKISVFNVNGKFQVRISSAPNSRAFIKSGPQSGSTGTSETKRLAPGQKPARLVINDNNQELEPKSNVSSGSKSGILPDMSSGSSKTKTNSDGKVNPNNAADVKSLSGNQ